MKKSKGKCQKEYQEPSQKPLNILLMSLPVKDRRVEPCFPFNSHPAMGSGQSISAPIILKIVLENR
jgi:hypothetical protein